MRQKKYLFFILITLVPMLSQAQYKKKQASFSAFPIVGTTVSQIEGDELKGFKKVGLTAGVGTLVSLDRSGQWQVSIETDFSQRGARNPTSNPYRLSNFTLNYVDIPLLLHYQDKYGGMNFGLGLCYSRLVQQPHGTVQYSPTYFIPDTTNMTFLRNDLSCVIDMRFSLWKGLKLNLRYQRSILPIKTDWTFQEYTNASEPPEVWTNKAYNSSVSVRLLYVFGEDNKKNKNHKRR